MTTKGKTVQIEGQDYVEIIFTRSILPDVFKKVARLMYDEECIFSKEIKKWFCPLDWYEVLEPKIERLVSTEEEHVDELGDKLAREWERQ